MGSNKYDFLPRLTPAGWRVFADCSDGAGYINERGLIVIANEVCDDESERWLHVSCSYDEKSPTLGELNQVKMLFMGAERTAFQILPPSPLMIHGATRTCFHLWSSLSGREFPRVLRR